jgi:hypothetical protein
MDDGDEWFCADTLFSHSSTVWDFAFDRTGDHLGTFSLTFFSLSLSFSLTLIHSFHFITFSLSLSLQDYNFNLITCS